MGIKLVGFLAVAGAALIGNGIGASPLLETRGKFVTPPPVDHPIVYDVHGKFIYPRYVPEATIFTGADLQALQSVQELNKLLSQEFSLHEYQIAIYKAKVALDIAMRSGNATGLGALRSALAAHTLAYDFWQACLNAPNEFFCDENRPEVAEILRLYAKPRMAERLPSVEEIRIRYPKPWVETRIRATLREVVEYIPTPEQKRVLRLLWLRALQDTEEAAISLGRS